MSVRLGACLALLAAGCPGPSEYVCPDPVGKIILDDCEAYRVKYESLKAELGASLAGLVRGNISLGQSSLRDPSELIQVLSHRTHALCKDFNACRVQPLEYRQRREQADRLFTAITAIQTQLQGKADAGNKATLVRELVRLLSEDQTAATSSTPRRTRGGKSGERVVESTGQVVVTGDFKRWIPWYGAKLLPPQPAGQPGFPQLAGAAFSLEHVFRQESPFGIMGFSPSATFWLRGKIEADDLLIVSWGGKSIDCPIGHGQENDLVETQCKPGEKQVVLTGTSFSLKVVYRRASDGQAATIDQRTVAVLFRDDGPSWDRSTRYGIDLDHLVREPCLVFEPHGEALSPEFDQPVVDVVFKRRQPFEATMRCWVNGKPAVGPLEGEDAYHGQFQDRPRHRDAKKAEDKNVEDPTVEWRSQRFHLPFLVRRERLDLPPGRKPWPLAGDWRCAVSVESEPVRELTFTVKPDGTLKPHPRQTEHPRAGWLIDMKVSKNAFEEPVP